MPAKKKIDLKKAKDLAEMLKGIEDIIGPLDPNVQKPINIDPGFNPLPWKPGTPIPVNPDPGFHPGLRPKPRPGPIGWSDVPPTPMPGYGNLPMVPPQAGPTGPPTRPFPLPDFPGMRPSGPIDAGPYYPEPGGPSIGQLPGYPGGVELPEPMPARPEQPGGGLYPDPMPMRPSLPGGIEGLMPPDDVARPQDPVGSDYLPRPFHPDQKPVINDQPGIQLPPGWEDKLPDLFPTLFGPTTGTVDDKYNKIATSSTGDDKYNRLDPPGNQDAIRQIIDQLTKSIKPNDQDDAGLLKGYANDEDQDHLTRSHVDDLRRLQAEEQAKKADRKMLSPEEYERYVADAANKAFKPGLSEEEALKKLESIIGSGDEKQEVDPERMNEIMEERNRMGMDSLRRLIDPNTPEADKAVEIMPDWLQADPNMVELAKRIGVHPDDQKKLDQLAVDRPNLLQSNQATPTLKSDTFYDRMMESMVSYAQTNPDSPLVQGITKQSIGNVSPEKLNSFYKEIENKFGGDKRQGDIPPGEELIPAKEILKVSMSEKSNQRGVPKHNWGDISTLPWVDPSRNNLPEVIDFLTDVDVPAVAKAASAAAGAALVAGAAMGTIATLPVAIVALIGAGVFGAAIAVVGQYGVNGLKKMGVSDGVASFIEGMWNIFAAPIK